MYAAVKERPEEFLLYISPVGEDLSIKMFGKHTPYPFITIVNVSRCQTESYDLYGVVADEVQLETVAPSHRAFPIFCKTGKHLVEKCLLRLWHTGIIVLSTKVMPEHLPKEYMHMNSISS